MWGSEAWSKAAKINELGQYLTYRYIYELLYHYHAMDCHQKPSFQWALLLVLEIYVGLTESLR